MFGTCKVCLEKDKRIADLKEQIVALNLQLVPTQQTRHYEMEQDFVLDGGGDEVHPTPTPISEEAQKSRDEQLALIQLEQDMLLSGSY